MPGRIPREFIDDVIARIDLVDLIDARVPLKKAGVNYKACCPFHTEKTPSFNVSREKQFYYCYGCGAHGNAIGFLMEYERQSFPEAVETLAESLGLRIPQEITRNGQQEQIGSLQSLYEVQERVAKFYARQLRDHPEAARAVAYLKKRGVSGEIAKQYLLGYAPPGWHGLPTSLAVEPLQAAGLVISREQGDSYDRFRDRIMFPIRDRRGRVVGFGGRVLGDETPKYLNSPETPVFMKHREVYGLYELLKAVRKPDRILVVEGYMDVIALAQGGIPYVVATLGTATSSEHVELLFRHANELVFCFDGDNAGRRAAWKALEASLPFLRDGRKIGFLMLPENHDPDSLVREEGAERFSARLTNAIPFSDYWFEYLSRQLNLQTKEGRAALIETAMPLIERLPAGVFREMMQARLSELAGRAHVQFSERSPKLWPRTKPHDSGRARPSALRRILEILVQYPGFFRSLGKEEKARLENATHAAGLIKKLFAILMEKPNISSGGILERLRGEPEENLVKTLLRSDLLVPEEGIESEFKDALKQFSNKQKDERLEELLSMARFGVLDQDGRDEVARLLSDR